jgi:hypothetical protein
MASRIIMAVQLTGSAKKAVETLTEKQGMTQVAMLSRLVEWFTRQPDKIQRSALSYHAEQNRATAGLILEHMASGEKA